MPRKIVDEKRITVADARKLLEKTDKEELGEFQRRTLDYTVKFSKLSRHLFDADEPTPAKSNRSDSKKWSSIGKAFNLK